jgi:histidine ammonia-lyase
MGANAATQLHRVMDNVQKLLGIEWLTAAQALDFRRPLQSSEVVEKYHKLLREKVPFIQVDHYMSPYMNEAYQLIESLA